METIVEAAQEQPEAVPVEGPTTTVGAAIAVPLPRFPPPALRVRPFRWYWAAQWPVMFGTWMQVVALGYFVYQVTGSQTAVGLVAAADGLPATFLPLIGGAIADRVPRRRMLLVTQSVLGAGSAGLALLAFSGHASLGAILVVAALYGSADSVDLPTRQALVGDLVSKDLLVSAVALSSMTMSATRIVGPSLGGLLIATAGPGVCFVALAAAYVVPIVVLVRVIPDIPPVTPLRRGSHLDDIVAGLRTALSDPLIRRLVVCLAALSFFGVAYMPYLPVLAKNELHSGAQVLGLLYSTGGVGGLVAGFIVASLPRGGSVRVRMLLGGGIVYGVGLFTLSHAHALGVALPALVLISFGFLSMNTSIITLLQTETDPAMRGRLLGIATMILAGLQPLGTLFYGLVSRVVPLFDAIGVGAIVVAVVAVLVCIGGPLRSLRTDST